ncbi:50S ribosomal protein L7/L12 [endosymbiont of Euscepes postfasciatus]|uniref:50S ribosomal protein L7/L12 n=1 Tax=endosymbiont of Euscepes postfasciatus TaxID=650377 RepID=UPI000DC713C4|nr:50S ribosomal protein L7/L12 [endosymbiont of Euscepes postfasciatus]BBA84700.1 50S ribosomal protein L7/L12 [endosymbiont of Euscepes postfasciatus]
MISKEDIVETISNMSVLEVSELILMIEKKFSIKYSDIILNNNKKENIEEKKIFNLTLKSVGSNKISVVKLVRSITNLGLKESKDLVESCPVIIKENIDKEEFIKIKKMFEDIGSIVDLN